MALTDGVTDWSGRDYAEVSGLQRAMITDAMSALACHSTTGARHRLWRWLSHPRDRRPVPGGGVAPMKIRFGVGLGADTGPDELPELIDRLEELGIDSLWFSELVYSKAVDPFVGMAFALARTHRLKVGTSVVVLPGRHPVLVAKQLPSLAALAPRRVLPVFGLRSAIPAERDSFAVPDGRRAAVFDESLRLLRPAWKPTARLRG